MQLISKNGITTRADQLPYDVIKVDSNVYQFRAIGDPNKPVVLATTNWNTALMMLVAQAPDQENN